MPDKTDYQQGVAFRLGVAEKLASRGVTLDEFHLIGADYFARQMDKQAFTLGGVTNAASKVIKGLGLATVAIPALALIAGGGGGYLLGRSPAGDVVNSLLSYGSSEEAAVEEQEIRKSMSDKLQAALDKRNLLKKRKILERIT